MLKKVFFKVSFLNPESITQLSFQLWIFLDLSFFCFCAFILLLSTFIMQTILNMPVLNTPSAACSFSLGVTKKTDLPEEQGGLLLAKPDILNS